MVGSEPLEVAVYAPPFEAADALGADRAAVWLDRGRALEVVATTGFSPVVVDRFERLRVHIDMPGADVLRDLETLLWDAVLDRPGDLVVDLAGLDYLDAAGIRALVGLSAAAGLAASRSDCGDRRPTCGRCATWSGPAGPSSTSNAPQLASPRCNSCTEVTPEGRAVERRA